MSRLGKRPVELVDKVKTEFKDKTLKVTGPLGNLEYTLPAGTDLEIKEGKIQVVADFSNARDNMMAGTARSIINNMVTGVSQGFNRKLVLVGVGYRAQAKGQLLTLNLGYSKPVEFELPKEVKAQVEGNTEVVLSSCDKQVLGQTLAQIRKFRMPEPYKGKGILFENEQIRRKAGKAGKTGK